MTTNYVRVNGKTLPDVRSISDPYKVRNATHNGELAHFDCQPRVEPTKLQNARQTFFSGLAW